MLNIELKKVISFVKSAAGKIRKIFIAAKNLQPMRRILKRFCKLPLFTYFEHILNIFGTIVVTQKIRLKKESHLRLTTRILKIGSHPKF